MSNDCSKCYFTPAISDDGVNYRGKPFSHDVDLLLTHHDTAVTDCLLHTLLARLQTLVYLI